MAIFTVNGHRFEGEQITINGVVIRPQVIDAISEWQSGAAASISSVLNRFIRHSYMRCQNDPDPEMTAALDEISLFADMIDPYIEK